MTSSMHSDLQIPSYSSDMRILMENMQALNVTDRHDDIGLHNSSSVKSKEPRSMIPVRQYTPSSYRTMPSQSHTTDASDVRHSLRTNENHSCLFSKFSIQLIDQQRLILH